MHVNAVSYTVHLCLSSTGDISGPPVYRTFEWVHLASVAPPPRHSGPTWVERGGRTRASQAPYTPQFRPNSRLINSCKL